MESIILLEYSKGSLLEHKRRLPYRYTRLVMTGNREKQVPTHNNFEISLVIFLPNITPNHAITYTDAEELSDMY